MQENSLYTAVYSLAAAKNRPKKLGVQQPEYVAQVLATFYLSIKEGVYSQRRQHAAQVYLKNVGMQAKSTSNEEKHVLPKIA